MARYGELQFYNLTAEHGVVAVDMGEWQGAGQHVDCTEIGQGVDVRTIFLGTAHNYFRDGPPILFETMIFGGPHDQRQWRHCTWDEAVTGHNFAVALARARYAADRVMTLNEYREFYAASAAAQAAAIAAGEAAVMAHAQAIAAREDCVRRGARLQRWALINIAAAAILAPLSAATGHWWSVAASVVMAAGNGFLFDVVRANCRRIRNAG